MNVFLARCANVGILVGVAYLLHLTVELVGTFAGYPLRLTFGEALQILILFVLLALNQAMRPVPQRLKLPKIKRGLKRPARR